MDEETTRAKMLEQLDYAQRSAMWKANGWQIVVAGLTAYVSLLHRRQPEYSYLLRVHFDDFPRRAPSYHFVDKITRDECPDAWPPNVKHVSTGKPIGICTLGTRECHEHYHLNQPQYPWNPKPSAFLETLQNIQKMMERGIGE